MRSIYDLRFTIYAGISLLLCVLGCGCASYSHTRLLKDGSTEKTSVTTFLMTSKASNLHTTIKDGTYTRSVGLGEIAGTGDTATIKAIVEAAVTAATKAVVPIP